MSYKCKNSKFNLNLHKEKENPLKEAKMQKNLSANKKYTQEEFTFILADTTKKPDAKLKTATSNPTNSNKKEIRSCKTIHDVKVNSAKTPKSKEENKTEKERKVVKRLHSMHINLVENYLESNSAKFTHAKEDEYSNFTFLNCFNGNKNYENEYSALSGLNNVTEVSNFNLENSSRKKSYQEDFPVQIGKREEFFNLSFERSKHSSNSSNDHLNCGLITEEKIGDLSVQHVRNYYEYTFECMKKIKKLNKISDEDFLVVGRENVSFEKKVLSGNKRLAIFDLEETLVHCVINPQKYSETFDEIFECVLNGKKTKIGLNKRPFLREALLEISKNYTLVIFSANKKAFSDVIINRIDPKGSLFALRLYRSDCISQKIDNENVFVKDLRIFKTIPIKRIVVVDKCTLSVAFQIDNGIPILPFTNSKTDNELKILVSYLTHLSQYDDIVEENKKVFGLENIITSFSVENNNDNYLSDVDKKNFENCHVLINESVGSFIMDDCSKVEDSDPKNKFTAPDKSFFNNLNLNFIRNNFNSNSSYESNSLLSCLILMNKGTLNYDSICNNNTFNTHIFLSSDNSKSDSEYSERKYI